MKIQIVVVDPMESFNWGRFLRRSKAFNGRKQTMAQITEAIENVDGQMTAIGIRVRDARAAAGQDTYAKIEEPRYVALNKGSQNLRKRQAELAQAVVKHADHFNKQSQNVCRILECPRNHGVAGVKKGSRRGELVCRGHLGVAGMISKAALRGMKTNTALRIAVS